MKLSDAQAELLVLNLLEKTGEALLSGCFSTFSRHFALPQTIETFETRRVVTSFLEWNGIFDDVRAHYEKLGVTQLVRSCLEVKVLSMDLMICTHETRLMHENRLLIRPFPVFSEVRRFDETWKVTRSSYAIPDSPGYTRALSGPSGKE